MNYSIITPRSQRKSNTHPESMFEWKSTQESNIKADQEEIIYPEFYTASWHNDSLFKKQLQDLELHGLRFHDRDFPAIPDSLAGTNQDSLKKWPGIRWATAAQIFGPEVCLYKTSPDSESIRQGILGNIYFTTVLMALAQNPDRIKKLFLSANTNAFGCYSVRLCIQGEWQEILIDDKLPVLDKNPKKLAFTSGKEGEIWVPLIEKAWAKINGSYANVEICLPLDLLHDLTGAPTQFCFIENQNPENVWRELQKATKLGYVVLADSKDQSKDGLLDGHYYIVQKAFELNLERQSIPIRLIKLRDPWNQTIWKGDELQQQLLWTDELKRQDGLSLESSHEFLMSFGHFFRLFENLQICRVEDNFSYCHYRICPNQNKGSFIKLNMLAPGNYTISIKQRGKILSEEVFNYICMIIAKVLENGELHYIDGVFEAQREVWKENYLQNGFYIVYVKERCGSEAPQDLVLSSYGKRKVYISEISKDEVPLFLERTLISRVRASKSLLSYQNEGEPNVYKSFNLTGLGLGYFYFCNRSKGAFNTTISFQNMSGIKLRKPFSNQKAFSIKLDAGQEKIVLTKIGPSEKKVKQAFIEKSEFEKDDDDLIQLAKQHGVRKQRIDSHSNNPIDIWFYLHQYYNGVLVVYENKTTDTILEEDLKFDLEGLQIREEKQTNQIKVIVQPGENRIINLDKTAEEFSVSYTVSYITKPKLLNLSAVDSKELVTVIKQKGDKKTRKDLANNQEIDISLFIYQNPYCIFLYYENNTTDKILIEEMKLELEGIELENAPTARILKIKLNPSDFRLFKLIKMTEYFKFCYTVTYFVQNVKMGDEVSSGFHTPIPKPKTSLFFAEQDTIIQNTLDRSSPWVSFKKGKVKYQDLVSLSPHIIQSNQYNESKDQMSDESYKRRAQLEGECKQRVDVTSKEYPDIWLYILQLADRVIMYYLNNTSDRLLDEVISFNLNGIVLEEDSNSSVLRLRLGPKSDRLIKLLKISEEYTVSYNTAFAIEAVSNSQRITNLEEIDWILASQAKRVGERKQRNDSRSGASLDIWLYILQYSDGVYFYYENNEDNLQLDEEINFQLKGMKIANNFDENQREIIVVSPRSRKGLIIHKSQEDYSLTYKINYIIRKF